MIYLNYIINRFYYNNMQPVNKFYTVTITYSQEDNNGKVKKVKETHLVDAVDPADVQTKVIKAMDDELIDEYEITQIALSNIMFVYGDCVKE